MRDPIQTAKFVCKAECVQELTDALPRREGLVRPCNLKLRERREGRDR